MKDPAGNALQRSVERLDTYAFASFGVRLTLTGDGNGTPHSPDPDVSAALSRTIGCAHGERRLLLAHGSSGPRPGSRARSKTFSTWRPRCSASWRTHRSGAIEPLREQLWRDLLGAPTIAGTSAASTRCARRSPPRQTARSRCSSRVSPEAAAVPSPPPSTGPARGRPARSFPRTSRRFPRPSGRADLRIRRPPGLLAMAAGGTLYLGAIEHLPARAQERLRILTADAATGERPRARIVASADVDLGEAGRRDRFRRDLAERLTSLVLAVPPLRERPEDIPLIAFHLLSRHAAARGATPPAIAPEALAALKMHHWAGNVRQLDEALVRAGSGRTVIRPDDLPASVSRAGRAPADEDAATLRQAVGELEVGMIGQPSRRPTGTRAAQPGFSD